MKLFCCLILLFTSNLLVSQSALKAPIPEEQKTQILILASPHLSPYKEQFKKESLDELIKVLTNWNPDQICVEALAPLSMHVVASNPVMYESVLEQFGGNILAFGHHFQTEMNCTWSQAMSRYDSVGRRLQVDHQNLNNKISFIQYAFASYRFYTGLIQWTRLEAAEKEKLKMPEAFSKKLEAYGESSNEIIQVAQRLALDLGFEEIQQIDDHLDKDLFMRIAPALVNELNGNEEYAKISRSGFYKESNEKLAEGLENNNLLQFYKVMNSDSYQLADHDEQWNLFFRTNLDSKLDRIRVGLWEVRNLNIASNIRRSSSLYPGQKILVIIGSSHKIFLDNYLRQMMDTKLVNINDLK